MLAPGALSRPYVQMEVREAVASERRIVVLFDQDSDAGELIADEAPTDVREQLTAAPRVCLVHSSSPDYAQMLSAALEAAKLAPDTSAQRRKRQERQRQQRLQADSGTDVEAEEEGAEAATAGLGELEEEEERLQIELHELLARVRELEEELAEVREAKQEAMAATSS